MGCVSSWARVLINCGIWRCCSRFQVCGTRAFSAGGAYQSLSFNVAEDSLALEVGVNEFPLQMCQRLESWGTAAKLGQRKLCCARIPHALFLI